MGCNDVCNKHGFTITRQGFCAVCTPWVTDHTWQKRADDHWSCEICGAPKHRHWEDK